MFLIPAALGLGTLLAYLAAHVWLIVLGVKARRWRTPGASWGLAGGVLGLAWPALMIAPFVAGLGFGWLPAPEVAEQIGNVLVRGMFAVWGLSQAALVAAAWRGLAANRGAAG